MKTKLAVHPDYLLIYPDQPICAGGAQYIFSKEHADNNYPSISPLFDADEIITIFICTDYIQLQKRANYKWEKLEGKILTILENSVFESEALFVPSMYKKRSIFKMVKKAETLIDNNVRPALKNEDGDVVIVGGDQRYLYARLEGTALKDAQDNKTLIFGILTFLKFEGVEIENVLQVY